MAQLIKIADAEALDDLSAESLIRNTTSETYGAIKDHTATMVADAVAASPTVVAAAETAAQDAATGVIGTALYDRGDLANGVDLNTLFGASNNGIWSLPSANSYPNRTGTWAARLEVVSTTNNTTEQILYRFTTTETWRRVLTATAGPTWSPWEKVFVPHYRGTLTDATDWNTLRNATWNGAWMWTVPQIEGMVNMPPVSNHGVLEVITQDAWQVMQRVTENGTNRVYIRSLTNPNSVTWTAWERQAKLSEIPAPVTGDTKVSLSRDWLHVGDSLTDDVVLGPEQWGNYMGTLDGAAHEIKGWYNQETFEIAARMGGVLYPVTVSGETIPASGTSVVVTGQRTDQLAFGGYADLQTREIPGWLNGRHGKLRNPDNGPDMDFTPDDGEAATSATGTVWFQGDMDQYLNRIVTIWAGTNDRGERSTDYLVGHVRAMVERIPHGRFFVFTLFSDPNGTYTTVSAQISDAYRAAFPGNIFDPLEALLDPQAEIDAGVTYTVDDDADIAAGYVPRSLRSDSIHLNDQGGIALAHAVHRAAQERGWSM